MGDGSSRVQRWSGKGTCRYAHWESACRASGAAAVQLTAGGTACAPVRVPSAPFRMRATTIGMGRLYRRSFMIRTPRACAFARCVRRIRDALHFFGSRGWSTPIRRLEVALRVRKQTNTLRGTGRRPMTLTPGLAATGLGVRAITVSGKGARGGSDRSRPSSIMDRAASLRCCAASFRFTRRRELGCAMARFVSALTPCRHDDRFASPATCSMCVPTWRMMSEVNAGAVHLQYMYRQ